jgi:ribosomal protein uS13
MARIAGINIPMNKHISIGLTHIFGIGRSRALDTCAAAGVDPSTRVKDLTEVEVTALRAQLSRYPLEGDLRREVSMNIKRHAPSQGAPGPWPAYAHQRTHAQGPAQAGREAQRPARQGLIVGKEHHG